MTGEILPPRPSEESERNEQQNPLRALDNMLGELEFRLPLTFLTTQQRATQTNRLGLVREGLRKKEDEWRQMVADTLDQTGIHAKTGPDLAVAINEVWGQTDADSPTRELTFLQSLSPDDMRLMNMILQALQRPLENVGSIPGWVRRDEPTSQFGRKYHTMTNPQITTPFPSVYLSLSLGTLLPHETLPAKLMNTIRSLRQPKATNTDLSTTSTQNAAPESIKIAFTTDKPGFEKIILSPPLHPYERQRID